MARTSIHPKTQIALWTKAGGRCEYRGCNENLLGDLVAGREDGTFGFIAHVVADSADGPRGDAKRSPRLARDLANLMLLCARHHKLIDVDGLDEHPEDVLLAMKAEHEDRVATATAIDHDRESHVIRFGADIGKNEALVSTRAIFMAMQPDHHPASGQTIDLELVGSAFRDDERAYWDLQRTNLGRQFDAKVRGRIERQEVRHLSVFALAPQPLLVELGRLLGDIAPATVHQRHREPPTWKWQPDQPGIDFVETKPSGARADAPVALKLALSATVDDSRIRTVLGDGAAIWSLTAANPYNDSMRRPQDLSAFRTRVRRLLDRIKATHGEGATLNLFPALPNSAAVEVGRVWMPKADLPMLVFDQNRTTGGFLPTFVIG